VRLATLKGESVDISSRDVQRLRQSLSGRLIQPGDEDYDAARSIWNARIDRKPGVIVRCTNTSDIAAALRFAEEFNLFLSTRAGGHNHTGHSLCDGGMTLDLSAMRKVRVDSERAIAEADGGATFAEYDAATQAAGLASTGAIVSMVGVAGYTLGGGIGWLHRKMGLGCDNLVAAEVVSAKGEILQANTEENPDLLWALRGGGGNFGVVSSFQFKLHPLREVLAGIVFYPLEELARVGRVVAEMNEDAPDELTVWMLLRRAPSIPALPPEMHGVHVAAVGICYAGTGERAEKAVQPLRRISKPLADLVKARPYAQWQSAFDSIWGDGYGNEWMGHYLPGLSEAALATLQKHVEKVPSRHSDVKVARLGGAMARVEENATAFSFRDSAYALAIQARWSGAEEEAENLQWIHDFFEDMKVHSTGRVYVNFIADEGPLRVADAYNAATFQKLRQIKARYDPENRFCLNQNIPPA
jgi:FAD/FMN-containing dehydrogenase